MSLPTSLLSYSDCVSLYEAALADPVGARLDFSTPAGAQYFVARMHQCRVLDRKFNAEVHTKGAKMHGRSHYDSLVCRIKPGRIGNDMVWWVYVERAAARIEGFQSLSTVEDEALLLPQQPPRLLLPPPQGIKRRV